MQMTRDEALAIYESARARLPAVKRSGACERASSLADIADRFDVFFLDAFGVLNIGESAIPGVVDRVDQLRASGKRVLVLTNAAGRPSTALSEKYARLGYNFEPEDIISSRAVLLNALVAAPKKYWGVIAAGDPISQDLQDPRLTFLSDDPAAYSAVDAFLFLGVAEWTEARHSLLQAALLERPRPVWVGNPDVVAPREHGFTIEPGYFAHRIADRTGVQPTFYGKPFGNIFDTAFARLGEPVDPQRVLMVGDSLHTDVLGAQQAGVSSALITGYGFFAGAPADQAIAESGIAPDFILDRP